jgi:acarbose 7IV-phosphotransferase
LSSTEAGSSPKGDGGDASQPATAPRVLRVTVVGNPGLDTLVLLDRDDLDLRADGYFVRNVDTVGHAPAFVARGFARLGHDVRILGAVGDDPMGRLVTEVLAADGVVTDLLFTDPVGTARSVNLVFPDARRTFFYDGGSHMTLRPPAGLLDTALADTDLVVSSLPNWGRHVVAAARARGIPVAVDLQDVRAADDPYRTDFVDAADYLFASAAHLVDPVEAARSWLATGSARCAVLGQGARGATLVRRPRGATGHERGSADSVHYVGDPGSGPGAGTSPGPPPADDLRVHPQPVPLLEHDLPLVDTTGAGDSLAVGFLDGLLALGLHPLAALHRGQCLARIVASAPGAEAPVDRPRLDDLAAQARPGDPSHSPPREPRAG